MNDKLHFLGKPTSTLSLHPLRVDGSELNQSRDLMAEVYATFRRGILQEHAEIANKGNADYKLLPKF